MSHKHMVAALDLMERDVAAMRRGDWSAGLGFLAEDVVVRIPGRSRFAGAHRGRGAARRYLKSAHRRGPRERRRGRARRHAGEPRTRRPDRGRAYLLAGDAGSRRDADGLEASDLRQ
jgi:ketosteroid isomerase-like protein